MSDSDTLFAGSIPQLYESHLVPMIFAPYAQDLVARVRARPVSRLLEIAAGTGVVTRALALALDPGASIVATDLNPAMLEQAAAVGTARPVSWQPADAMALPFGDAEFDTVVCQFGAMFFPDKTRAFAEARRALQPGGRFLFNVWDRIEDNEFADTVTRALESVFHSDPPRFLARTPHGHHDPEVFVRALTEAGFTAAPRIETVGARSLAPSARQVAIAYCQGTPLRNEIDARDATRLAEATEVATQALERRFGSGPVEARIQALVIEVEA